MLTFPNAAALAGFAGGSTDNGELAYVETFRQHFILNRAISPTPDNVRYIAAGSRGGVWQRRNEAHPSWMSQTDWYIDPANATLLANDENSGVDAEHPLRTVDEFARRMTVDGWTQPVYHIRLLSDVPDVATTAFRLIVKGETTSRIYVHGSATDGAGKTTLYTGTATTVTPLNYAAGAGGQALEIIDAGVGSWLTAGTGGTTLINKRFRWTSGPNIGGKVWAIADLGGAQPDAKARFNEPAVVNAYTSTSSLLTTSWVPANGETYVVEELTKIPRAFIDVSARGAIVTFESVQLGSSTAVAIFASSPNAIRFDGCLFWFLVGSPLPSMSVTGCYFAAAPSTAYSWSISNSYSNVAGGSGGINLSALTSGSLTRWMSHGGATFVTCPAPQPGGWTLNQVGVFASTTYPIQVRGTASFATAGVIWGTGQSAGTAACFLFNRGANVRMVENMVALPASYFYMLAPTIGGEAGAYIALSLYNFGAGNAVLVTAPAYDQAVGDYVGGGERLLSAANLSATVAAGGFGGHFFHPITMAGLGI